MTSNPYLLLAQQKLDKGPGESDRAYITPEDIQTSYEYLRQAWAFDNSAWVDANTPRRVPPIRGINLSPWAFGTAGWEEVTAQFAPTHVTVPIRVEAASISSNTVTVNADDLARAATYSPGDALVIIEPYPWLDFGAASETEWEPTDLDAWELSYTAALLEIAAEFPDAWAFHIASNLIKIESETARWLRIIDAVRTELPTTQITYRTNWWITAHWAPETVTAFEERVENPLFGALDIISVAAYFELTETASPGQDEISDCLRSATIYQRFQDVYAECEQLALRWSKPLLFGELICARYDGALATPWRPWNPPDIPPPLNWMIQVRYFRAVYDTFRDAPWWAGFSVYGTGYPYADGGYNLVPAAVRYLQSVIAANAGVS